MTYYTMTALFSVMIAAAFIPSVSTLTVSARAVALGFSHGVLTTLGIVVGDILFILIAIYGLSLLIQVMGNYFSLIRYIGGIYLIWLGIMLWRTKLDNNGIINNTNSSLLYSFMTGLFITLGDQKAIFFYLGFLPAFIKLSTTSFSDTIVIIMLATVAIVIPKLIYAYLSIKTSTLFKETRIVKGINKIAGSIMICVGIFLMMKT